MIFEKGIAIKLRVSFFKGVLIFLFERVTGSFTLISFWEALSFFLVKINVVDFYFILKFISDLHKQPLKTCIVNGRLVYINFHSHEQFQTITDLVTIRLKMKRLVLHFIVLLFHLFSLPYHSFLIFETVKLYKLSTTN